MPGDVQFDEPTYTPRPRPERKAGFSLVEYLVTSNIAKDTKTAEQYLLVAAALMFIAAFLLLVFFANSSVAPPEPLPPPVVPR